MDILIKKEFDGFQSATMTKLGTQFVNFVYNDGSTAGFISGDQLNNELKKYGFKIVEKDGYTL